ncbi:MAG: hypothetical protein F6K58_09780 [Symploca sp. SIO2E9]|nr:hypothetical protein [Symploca sp. SIO2E9]
MGKSVLISITLSIIGLVLCRTAKADEWKPSLMVMPNINYLEKDIFCDGVNLEKKRLYLNEWGESPYVLLGEEVEISPSWKGFTRYILVRLGNGNEVSIDKACLISNPLDYYRTGRMETSGFSP